MLQKTMGDLSYSDLTGITVVSAFTDPDMIEQILNELRRDSPKKKTIRIFLDYGASGYHRDEDATDKLDRIGSTLSDSFHKNSGIFLINLGRFLHSKIFMLHTKIGEKVSLGSLNLTRRGFFSNEEILIHISRSSDITAIKKYISVLADNGGCRQVPFQESKKAQSSSYRDWLLRGSLFFEDKATSPYNFKLMLPKKLLRQPAMIIPGAEAEVPDNISLLKILRIPLNKRDSLRWKMYCVPTCYGYWCPIQLSSLARDSIETATTKRLDTRIEPILSEKENLKKRFLKLFDKIEKNILKYNKSNHTRHKWNRHRAEVRLDKWISRVVEKLKNEQNRFRLLAGVDETVMPDLWTGDEIALREFEQSFCIHVVFELSKSRVKNWVALWLRDEMEYPGASSLQTDWDGSWDDEEAWLMWLRAQDADPFEMLPDVRLEE